jgi:hypothetical protein
MYVVKMVDLLVSGYTKKVLAEAEGKDPLKVDYVGVFS